MLYKIITLAGMPNGIPAFYLDKTRDSAYGSGF
jgi:hypothetical protein